MAGGNFFGVTVEEAMERSGALQKIAETVAKMTTDQFLTVKANINILKQILANMKAEKEELSSLQKMTRTQLQKSQQLKTETKRIFYAQKLLETTVMADAMKQKLNNHVIQGFRLEHTILDTISGGFTSTLTYSIYFYTTGGKNTGNEITRGTIAAKDLYDSQYLKIDSKGNLMISRDVIKAENLFQEQSTTLQSSSNYDQTLAADLEALVKETYSFIQSVQQKYYTVSAQASSRHLGNALDSEYDTTSSVVESSEEVIDLIHEKQAEMQRYLLNIPGIKKPAGRLNRGHLVEAYERLLQERLQNKKPLSSYYKLLKDSLGNDPWYIGGDVGDIQVKSFFDNNDRRIASYASIIELGNNLINLVEDIDNSLTQISQTGAQRIKEKEGSKFSIANAALTKKEEEIRAALSQLKI